MAEEIKHYVAAIATIPETARLHGEVVRLERKLKRARNIAPVQKLLDDAVRALELARAGQNPAANMKG